MRKTYYLIFLYIILCSCSTGIDKEADRNIRALLIQIKEPGLMDSEVGKGMMCSALRLAISGLTFEGKRISDKTLNELNEYTDKCGLDRYENR